MTRTLPTLTLDTFMSGLNQPCEEWTEGRLREICDRYQRQDLDALQVLAPTEVSPEDRVWLACRVALCPPAVARRFAVDVAAQALRRAGTTDKRSWAALNAALAYERGETDEEALEGARAAAWDVARYAVRYSVCVEARAAAWSAARAAARNASWAASWAATWAAARNVSWDAARDAAWIDHCDRLTALLLRWVDGQDVLVGSVERAEVSS